MTSISCHFRKQS